METEVNLRPAVADDIDIDAFLQLQRESPEASQWTAEDYSAKLGHVSTLALVADVGEGKAAVGFLFAQVTADDMEILNFAVAREHRRHGVGRAMLVEGLRQGFERGARRCFLDVRASNHAALLFYQGQGFAELYRRQNYYSDPPDDAIVWARDLPFPQGQRGAS